MPELPEVETVIRVLKNSIIDKTISEVEILYSPIIENEDSYFTLNVVGKKIVDINRYGKYLIFCLHTQLLFPTRISLTSTIP